MLRMHTCTGLPVSFEGNAWREMSISRTYFTPSISRAGNVFQYMVTGTTTGEFKASDEQFLGIVVDWDIAEVLCGESVSLDVGVRTTYDVGVPWGVICRDDFGGVALKSVNKSKLMSRSLETRRSASVKSSEILLVWLCWESWESLSMPGGIGMLLSTHTLLARALRERIFELLSVAEKVCYKGKNQLQWSNYWILPSYKTCINITWFHLSWSSIVGISGAKKPHSFINLICHAILSTGSSTLATIVKDYTVHHSSFDTDASIIRGW